MHISRGFLIRLAVSLLLLGSVFFASQGAFAQHGCDPGNMVPNCNFDGPFSPQGNPDWKVPSGWSPFVLSGSLSFQESTDTAYGAPSLMMVSDGGTFDAGVFAQVSGAQPGTTYKASVGWFAPSKPEDSFTRQLGIDPTGGTDPGAATVVWGPEWSQAARKLNYPPPDVNIDVSAVARSSKITVFARARHTYSTGLNYIFLDAVSLVADSSQPVQPVSSPTPPPPSPTALPPSPTPLPLVATAVPTLVPPTETPVDTPTSTATSAPSSTPTLTPSPTPVQTATSMIASVAPVSLTSTLPPRPTATLGAPGSLATRALDALSATQGVDEANSRRSTLLLGGLGALGGAGLLAVAVAMIRRR